MNDMFNKKMEIMDKEKIRELQLKRLKETVHRVYDSVSFYRKKLDEKGVSPDDVKTLDDIRKLPFTTKNDLRVNAPFGMLAVPLEECVELHASSGTTGTPITVCYTPRDIDVWSEVMARCLAMAGLTKKDVFQNPIPYGTFTGAFGFHYGAQKVGALVVPTGKGQSERQIKLMGYYGVTFISGVASYILHLGQVARDMGVEPSDLKLHSGLFGAEMFTKELKKKIQDIWGIDVHDIYGLTEMCGPGVSSDCDEHNGLHLWEDHFFVEVVDPMTLEPVDVEEEGELVITTLTKEGMPLLRYRTRDISKLYDVKVCNCGRTHVKHASIKGRTDDMVIVRGTNVYPGQIESVLMKHPVVGSNWRMVILREEGMDQLVVEVESSEKLDEQVKKDLESLLRDEIKSVITLTPRVVVLPPGSIPLEGLKAKRVVDRR
ncbi:MAG TPA: phenylacetate--CoA ligase family protein [Thermoplasmata archaeon]|nr:phenylacetate--CoA ligase family protein [Thermoplasmata archaeon]